MFGETGQLGLERGGKVDAFFGDAESGAVVRQPGLAFGPGKQLIPVVGKLFGAHDVKIASLQLIGQMDEDADFEGSPVAGRHTSLADEALPALRSKAQIDRIEHLMAAYMAVLSHRRQSVKQAAVLCRRPDIQQIDQFEQQTAVLGMNGP